MINNKLTENYKEALLNELKKVISFNTIKSEAKEGMPFGQGNADCLDYVLNLGKEMGFETYNCDNYAGHIDFGTGEETFGILGHLDVVPVTDEGWVAPPFSGDIVDNKMYGRGTLDDKGPMISALFACKILKDEGFKPSKKIRLIFGCDEESGMGCIRYYSKKVPLPQMGFSPDGDFPVINVEKGIYGMMVNAGKLNENILDISAGSRINVVPDKCFATINKGVDTEILTKYGVAFKDNGDTLTLSTLGKSTHGANPQLGVNATWNMFKALSECYKDDDTLNFVANKIAGSHNGENWGFKLEDEVSGKLTISIGTVKTEKSTLILGIDVRYPISFTDKQIVEYMTQNSPEGFMIMGGHASKPLFVDEKSELVQTLLKAYEDVTGQKGYTIAIGGGTYSRMLPMCVAFGPCFPNEMQVIHETNENISLDNLFLMTETYKKAIYELCK